MRYTWVLFLARKTRDSAKTSIVMSRLRLYSRIGLNTKAMRSFLPFKRLRTGCLRVNRRYRPRLVLRLVAIVLTACISRISFHTFLLRCDAQLALCDPSDEDYHRMTSRRCNQHYITSYIYQYSLRSMVCQNVTRTTHTHTKSPINCLSPVSTLGAISSLEFHVAS